MRCLHALLEALPQVIPQVLTALIVANTQASAWEPPAFSASTSCLAAAPGSAQTWASAAGTCSGYDAVRLEAPAGMRAGRHLSAMHGVHGIAGAHAQPSTPRTV